MSRNHSPHIQEDSSIVFTLSHVCTNVLEWWHFLQFSRADFICFLFTVRSKASNTTRPRGRNQSLPWTEVLCPQLTQALSHTKLLALQLLCKEPVSLFVLPDPASQLICSLFNSVPGPEHNSHLYGPLAPTLSLREKHQAIAGVQDMKGHSPAPSTNFLIPTYGCWTDLWLTCVQLLKDAFLLLLQHGTIRN